MLAPASLLGNTWTCPDLHGERETNEWQRM